MASNGPAVDVVPPVLPYDTPPDELLLSPPMVLLPVPPAATCVPPAEVGAPPDMLIGAPPVEPLAAPPVAASALALPPVLLTEGAPPEVTSPILAPAFDVDELPVLGVLDAAFPPALRELGEPVAVVPLQPLPKIQSVADNAINCDRFIVSPRPFYACRSARNGRFWSFLGRGQWIASAANH